MSGIKRLLDQVDRMRAEGLAAPPTDAPGEEQIEVYMPTSEELFKMAEGGPITPSPDRARIAELEAELARVDARNTELENLAGCCPECGQRDRAERAEAELARVTKERDEADVMKYHPEFGSEWYEVEAERHRLRHALVTKTNEIHDAEVRAERAEARVAALREILRSRIVRVLEGES